jgi:hypothetical protein
MNGRGLVSLVLLAMTAGFPGASADLGPGREPQIDLRTLLPSSADLRGWTPKDAPRVFKGDDLFLYIDGGADVYQEYGFKQVIAQDYRDANGRSVSLEVYEMVDAAASYGMFTFKSSGKGRAAAVGQNGQVEDYYLNFWKGSYLVTAVGFDDSAECRAGITRIAAAVDSRLKTTGPRPKLADVFPREWTDVTRVVYFKGPLAADNIYAYLNQYISLNRDLYHFAEGAAAERGLYEIFVLRYETAKDAGQAFAKTEQTFRQNAVSGTDQPAKAGTYEARDAKGNILYARLFEDRIHLIVDANRPSDPTSVEAILTRLEKSQR